MKDVNPASVPCPLCGGNSEDYRLPPEPGEPRRCLSCGLVFVHSTAAREDSVQLFTRAYQGGEERAEMDEFHKRLLTRHDVLATKVNLKWAINPAHHKALTLIKKTYPKGCTVFDIGCGLGYFLLALRASGYKAVGLEVGEPMVELLRKEGFPMWLGTIDTLPPGWVEPQVCTAFFMLGHVPDPMGFLRAVRERFPKSLFIMGVPDMLDKGPLPRGFTKRALPRGATWWGKKQVELAFEKAGYKTSVMFIPLHPRGYVSRPTINLYMPLRKWSPRAARWLVALHYRLMPILGWLGALWMRWHYRSYSMLLVVAEPL
jgi:SAM-dependent methyltransferase